MVAAIAAAMGLPNRLERNMALEKIGPYRSRGKGRGKAFDKSWFSLNAVNNCNNGGKGRPHQGEREKARRLRQKPWLTRQGAQP